MLFYFLPFSYSAQNSRELAAPKTAEESSSSSSNLSEDKDSTLPHEVDDAMEVADSPPLPPTEVS